MNPIIILPNRIDLSIGYSVMVTLTGLPIGYSALVTLRSSYMIQCNSNSNMQVSLYRIQCNSNSIRSPYMRCSVMVTQQDSLQLYSVIATLNWLPFNSFNNVILQQLSKVQLLTGFLLTLISIILQQLSKDGKFSSTAMVSDINSSAVCANSLLAIITVV